MHEQRFGRRRRAISPAVGATLLMAITVVLATTTASVFFGVGDRLEQNRAPATAFAFDYDVDGDGERLTISHASGDTLRRQHVHLVVSGAHCDGAPTEDPDGRYLFPASRSELAAGTRGTLDSGNLCGGSGSLVLAGTEVEVVWVGPPNVNSRTLMRWRGPSR